MELSRFIDKNEQINCLFPAHPKLKFLCHAVFACGGNFLPWYLHFCSLVHLPHPTPEPSVYNCLPAPMTAVVETLAETGKVQTITIFLLLLLLDWLSCKHCKRQVTHERNVMWDIWPIREEFYLGQRTNIQSALWGSTGQWAALLGSTSQVIHCRLKKNIFIQNNFLFSFQILMTATMRAV